MSLSRSPDSRPGVPLWLTVGCPVKTYLTAYSYRGKECADGSGEQRGCRPVSPILLFSNYRRSTWEKMIIKWNQHGKGKCQVFVTGEGNRR